MLDGMRYRDHQNNPLISPSKGWMIADPSVLLPDETPDGLWYLVANSIPPLLHAFVSEDGVGWRPVSTFMRGAMRPFVRKYEGRYWLFFEQVRWWFPLRSRLMVAVSDDLQNWTDPRVVLEPCLPWHGRFNRTCSNATVVPFNGEWLLFYSAATVWLRDCFFVEPRYVGLARAPRLEGPWTPEPEPILWPSPSDPLRNLGAGAMRVVVHGDTLWGFNNGIYTDSEGRSRSAVELLCSTDGMQWVPSAAANPVLSPEGEGWKRALVYALDVRIVGDDEVRIYYNARDGWFRGTERIGLAVGRRL